MTFNRKNTYIIDCKDVNRKWKSGKNRKIFILNPISMEIQKAPILSPMPHEVGQGKVGTCMGEQKDKLSVLCEITLAGEIVILGTDSTLDFHDTSQWRLQVRS